MLNKSNCIFEKNENGFLLAGIDGQKPVRVKIVCTQPLTKPYEYVSVMSMEDEEYGIIENISDFDGEQRRLIEENIRQRYFCPVISEISSIKDKMGNFYFDVIINSKKKNFLVRDLTKNIRQYSNSITIIDTDGNRYLIDDINSVPKKSRRKLQPYLY